MEAKTKSGSFGPALDPPLPHPTHNYHFLRRPYVLIERMD